MKNLRIVFLGITLCLLTQVTVAQNLLKYVPADATAVIGYYPQNLKKKVDVNDLKKMGFMDMMLGQMTSGMPAEQKDLFKNTFQDPTLAGLHPMQASYVYVQYGADFITMGFLLPIQDQARLERFIQESAQESLVLQKKDGFMQADLNDGVMMAFNSDALMLIVSENNPAANLYDEGYDYEYEEEAIEEEEMIEEDKDQYYPPQNEKPMPETSGMQVQSLVYQAFKEGLPNSLMSNARFKNSEANKGDFGIWVDYGAVYGESGIAGQMRGMGDQYQMIMGLLGGLYQDMNVAMSVSFEDGLIDVTTQSLTNPKVQKWLKELTDEEINKKFHKYIDGEDLMGYYAFAFEQEALIDGTIELLLPSVKDVPMFGKLARDAAEILDIFVDQEAIYDILDGDFFFGVTGMGQFTKTVTSYEYDENFNEIETTREVTTELPKFLMMASYEKEDYINRFIRLGEHAGLTKNMGSYQVFKDLPDVPFDVFVTAQKGILFITNDAQLIQNQIQSGVPKSRRLSKAHCKRLRKKNFNGFVDFDNILKVAGPYAAMGGDQATEALENFKKTFDEVVMYSERGKEDLRSNIQLTFKDESRNSLEQFFLFMNELAMSTMGVSM